MIEYTGLFILDGSTSDPAVLTRVLDALASTSDLAPEHWGSTERVKKPFSPKAVEKFVATEKADYPNFYSSSVIVSRAKKLAASRSKPRGRRWR